MTALEEITAYTLIIQSYPFIREEQWINYFKSHWKCRVALHICYKYSDFAICYKVTVCPRGHMEETYFCIRISSGYIIAWGVFKIYKQYFLLCLAPELILRSPFPFPGSQSGETSESI